MDPWTSFIGTSQKLEFMLTQKPAVWGWLKDKEKPAPYLALLVYNRITTYKSESLQYSDDAECI